MAHYMVHFWGEGNARVGIDILRRFLYNHSYLLVSGCLHGFRCIQSAYSIPDQEKREQETFSLRHTGNMFPKLVITGDPFQARTYDDHVIAHMGVD